MIKILAPLKVISTGLSLILAVPQALASLDEEITFSEPEQSLRETLISLGRHSDISIIFPSRLVQGYRAQQFEGTHSAREILQQLLEGTQLCFEEINSSVIAIIPAAPRTASPQTHGDIEEISVIDRAVTGSHIRRNDYQGSSPVDIISSPEINASGSQTLGDFLKYIPAVSGNSTSTAISNGGDGTATVTLRGLPANNTLVLLNGKRIANSGLSSDAVDLNSISPSSVERIEILKDGASAIYGSDAIAGVVNIILKDEYDGLLLEQYYGETGQGDTETTTTNLMWGKVFSRGSFIINATHYEQNGLFSRDRALSANADSRARGGADLRSSATPISRITFPDDTSFTLSGEPSKPAEPSKIADGTIPDSYRLATDEDLFNFSDFTSSISPSSRQSIYAAATYQLPNEALFRSEIGYAKNSATITLAPTPLFTAFEDIDIVVAADNIYNPFGVDFKDIRRRVMELGPREQHNESETRRVSFSLDGFWGQLHWNFSTHWSRTDSKEKLTNLLDGQHTQRALGPSGKCQGLHIDGCTPLNLFGPAGSITEEQLDYIQATSLQEGFSKLYGYSVHFESELMESDSGPWVWAAGFDYRREEVQLLLNNRTADDIFIGGGTFDPTIGSRNIYEAYSELQIPVLKQKPGVHSLYLEIAARHSVYSDYNDSTTPKIGIRYRPIPDLLLRATYSKGFRTPSLAELHKGGSQTQAFLNDPCTSADNVGTLPGCSQLADDTRNQFLTVFGGDTELSPEKSYSHTIGLVWSPIKQPGLMLSLDYLNIRQTNVIDANAQFIINQNARSQLFNDRVFRDENGNITEVLATFLNIGSREVRGIDVTMKYQWSYQQHNLAATFNAFHLQKFEDQAGPSTEPVNLAGTFSDEASEGNGALPDWKLNTGLHWTYGNFSAGYTVNYISELKETVPQSDKHRRIRSWITHDFQITYSLHPQKDFQLSFGADNLWDKAPPFAASAFNDNFDARTHDLKGRFWYARLTQSF